MERIGDHADNLAELALFKIENNITFSEKAVIELEQMVNVVHNSISKSLEAMKGSDRKLARDVIEIEGVVDEMEKHLRKTHIRRLNEGRCETNSGIIFLDIISNMERISDHAKNIAEAVLAVKN
jgi:phosphate:Na+ symporter